LEPSSWAEKDKRTRTGKTIGKKTSEGKYATSGSGTYRKDKMRNMRTVWDINTKGKSECHFATFPLEFPTRGILAGCPENGIVLDPFFGSGTTGMAAKNNNRNWIGIELNTEYIDIAKKLMGE
jgi:site-specific DNA-methyltransferase (adenine-specific)